jgi:protein-ribulosamine 3-kinase
MFNTARFRMDRAYIREYQRHIPPSAPEEDFDDRIILYRYRINLSSSMSYLDDTHLRELYVAILPIESYLLTSIGA